MAKKFKIGARVVSCNGDDSGRVLRAYGPDRKRPHGKSDLFIGWDSGIRTWAPPRHVCKAPR